MSEINWQNLLGHDEEDVEEFLLNADIGSIIFSLDSTFLKSTLFKCISNYNRLPGVSSRAFELLQDCHLLAAPGISNDELSANYDGVLKCLGIFINKSDVCQKTFQLLSMLAELNVMKEFSIKVEENELLFLVNRAITLHHDKKQLQRAALQLFESIIENAQTKALHNISNQIFKPVLDNLLLNTEDNSICHASFSILLALTDHATDIITPYTDQLINLAINTISRLASAEISAKCITLLYKLTQKDQQALLTVVRHPRSLFIFIDALSPLKAQHLHAAIKVYEIFIKVIEDYDVSLVAFQHVQAENLFDYAQTLRSSFQEKFDRLFRLTKELGKEEEENVHYLFILHNHADELLKEMLQPEEEIVPKSEASANKKKSSKKGSDAGHSATNKASRADTTKVVDKSASPPSSSKRKPKPNPLPQKKPEVAHKGGALATIESLGMEDKDNSATTCEKEKYKNGDSSPQESQHSKALSEKLDPSCPSSTPNDSNGGEYQTFDEAKLPMESDAAAAANSDRSPSPSFAVINEGQKKTPSKSKWGPSAERFHQKQVPHGSVVVEASYLQYLESSLKSALELNKSSKVSSVEGSSEGLYSSEYVQELMAELKISQLQATQAIKRADSIHELFRDAAVKIEELLSENCRLCDKVIEMQEELDKHYDEELQGSRDSKGSECDVDNSKNKSDGADAGAAGPAAEGKAGSNRRGKSGRVPAPNANVVVLETPKRIRANSSDANSTTTLSKASTRGHGKEERPSMALMGIFEGLEYVDSAKAPIILRSESLCDDLVDDTAPFDASTLESICVPLSAPATPATATAGGTAGAAASSSSSSAAAAARTPGFSSSRKEIEQHMTEVTLFAEQIRNFFATIYESHSVVLNGAVGPIDFQDSVITIRRLRVAFEAMKLIDGVHLTMKQAEIIFNHFRSKHITLFGTAFSLVICGEKRFRGYRGISLISELSALVGSFLSNSVAHAQEYEIEPLEPEPKLRRKEIDDAVKLFERDKKAFATLFEAYAPWIETNDSGGSTVPGHVHHSHHTHHDGINPGIESNDSRQSNLRIHSIYPDKFSLGYYHPGLGFPNALRFAKEFQISPDVLSRNQLHEIFCSVELRIGDSRARTGVDIHLSFAQFLDFILLIACRCPLFRGANATRVKLSNFMHLMNLSTGKDFIARRNRGSELIIFRPISETTSAASGDNIPLTAPVYDSKSRSIVQVRRKKSIEELRHFIVHPTSANFSANQNR